MASTFPMVQQDVTVSSPQNIVGAGTASILHRERRYQSYQGSNYILPTDAVERERLALQHRVLLQVLKNRLIVPNVTVNMEDHILDSGTGSGTWLLDVTNVVPRTTVIHGLDIEPGLFPREDDAVVSRGNVQFHVGSITALPADWTNEFKLVSQRLLIVALRREEWELALTEMLRVLVPGGWVQLGEIGAWKAGPETEKFTALVNAITKSKGLLLDCAVLIPTLLRTAGFTQVSVEQAQIPLGKNGGQLAVDARNNWIGAFRGLKTPVLKAGGLGYVSSEADFDFMLDAMEKEMQESADAEMEYNVICAQKPF